MTEHFIEKCESCGATISQCRCVHQDKEVRYSQCKICKKVSDYQDEVHTKHAENCECLLAHFLKETGFKAKDVWLFQHRSQDGLVITFSFAHKNTAKKHLYPQNHA